MSEPYKIYASQQYVEEKITEAQQSTAESIKYTAQELTDDQKSQARSNIGAEALGSADAALTSANAYTDEKVSGIVNSAPETLDTLNELAAALGNDENFATTVTTQIGNKVDKVDGKGLSTEDYTTEEKEKLAGISTKLSGFENDVGFITSIPAEYATDAIRYSAQTLTDEQKSQARTNIGSISQDELPAAAQSTFGAVKVENVVTNAVGGSGQYNSIYINEAGVIVSAKSVKYFDTMDQVSNQNTVNGNIAVVRSKGTSTIDVVYPAIVFSTTTQSHGWFDGWLIDAEGNYYTCNIKYTGVEVYTSQRKYGLPTPTADDNNKVLFVSEGAPIWTDVSIPSKTSDLTNDSGFLTSIPNEYVTDTELIAKGYLTSYTETDPTVPDWAKQPTKPTYTADEVGALPDTTVIPTNISELTNDSGYLTSIPAEYITETELESKGYLTSYTETDPTVPEWAKAATKPTYTAAEVGALPDDTVIPTKTSDLTNDSGFLTSIPSEYITETELSSYGYLTSYTETDPTVPAWAKEANKPTYTAAEVGALPADTVIPSIDGLATESYVDTAVATKITTPTTATVGQILSVKSVDTNGSPTEWETIDYNFVTEDRVNELITAALATTQSYYTGTSDPEDSLGSDGDIYLKTT